jgi:hypothetical protein
MKMALAGVVAPSLHWGQCLTAFRPATGHPSNTLLYSSCDHARLY